uniref:ATP-dependent DNA helicase n=1 Tax=Globodera rostochiensis TaxID=31243 RepID=A0A914H4I5_GLORO
MLESVLTVQLNTLDFASCASNSLYLPMMDHHAKYAEQRDKCPIAHCTNMWHGVKDVDYMPTCGNLTQQITRALPVERGRFGGRSKRQGASVQTPISQNTLSNLSQNTIDSMLMPPPSSLAPRRSTRVPKATAIFNTPGSSRAEIAPVTHMCSTPHSSHFGLGCGAIGAKHLPDYYNSITTELCTCPYCQALLLPSEAIGDSAFSKCCAKGRVCLRERFDNLQQRPANIMALFTNRDTLTIRRHSDLVQRSMTYNDSLAFGCIRIQRTRNFANSFRIVKCNNMIRYVLWDFNPPMADLPQLHGQLFTIPPADARLRIDQIAEDQLLDPELLNYLHEVLRENHPFANVYQTAAETYRQLEANDKLNFRMLVVDTNTKGDERAVEETGQQQPDANLAEPQERQIMEIHPGRINVETVAGSKLVAQFYLDTGANVPPSHEYDIILKGRQGTGERDMKWWNRNVDPTLFPLLFPRGQFGFENGIKLKLKENEKFDAAYRQLRENDGELIPEDKELGEEAEFLGPELERQLHRRDNTSRAQWWRYMTQLRGSWQGSHWLWDWHDLAQLYTIAFNNRVEAQKVQKLKQLQGQRRLVRVRALLQWVQQLRDNQGLEGTIGQIYMTDVHFRGSRQFYQKEYANCMTICREIGKPDLLITFTMDPDCPELQQLLPLGPDGKRHQWYDRPDIVCRLFIDKRDELLDDLTKRMVLGSVIAWFFALEFQMRGLPHIHICLTLDWERIRLVGRIQTPEDYMAEYICAEIPALPSGRSKEAILQRELHKTITTKHIHTCSAQRCLVDGKCTKHFPKPFSYAFVFSENAFPRYLRRPPAPTEQARLKNPERYGNTFEQKTAKGKISIKNNSFVIPFNPFLSAKFKSHINVEFVAGEGCTKYLCKYVMKGADMCFVQITEQGGQRRVWRYDEFHQIRLSRYVTSIEAFMSLWGVPLVQRSHQVEELDVHGPEGHRIAVEEGQEEEAAMAEEDRIERGEERKTQLTAYFSFNQLRKDEGNPALKLTYATCFKKIRYDLHKKEWALYIREARAGQKLCRLKTVSPSNLELLALRHLLFVVEDPTDWADLRLFDEVQHVNFVEAAKARGLLVDNILWKRTIIEAFATKKSARQRIRWLAVFFATSNLANPAELLDEILQLPDNWLVNTRVAGSNLDERRQYVLRALEWFLRAHGVEPDDLARPDGSFETACEHIALPRPVDITINREDYIALQFNRDDIINANLEPELRDPELNNCTMQQRYMDLYQATPYPNEEQKELIKEVNYAMLDAARVIDGHGQEKFTSSIHRLFMVTGEGGAGKTFTYNSTGFNFLPMATTGIAAELLYEGQTVHKRICRRKHVDSSTPLSIDYDSRLAEMLRRTHGLLIDEISMQHKDVLEFVDRLLRSIAPTEYLRNTPFAGKVVILGGDWKQLAPVVPGGGDTHQLNASVKTSDLFEHFVTRKLRANHRLRTGQDSYRRFLLRVGTGNNNNKTSHRVTLKQTMCVASREELIDFVFPAEMLNNPLKHGEELGGCAILSPLNRETFELNETIMDRIVGPQRVYIATTQPVRDETGLNDLANVAADADCENLSRMTPSGLPEHILRIKVGAIMMIIANISIADGLCNGTRVQILPGPKGRLTQHIIRCRILSGNKRGNEHDLHAARFVFGGDPNAKHEGLIKCERVQFPLRPGNVMTINKSQGQTLSRVGVLLDKSSCFSHGQLYVALSRVKDEAGIRICTKQPNFKVKNVVMQELLDTEDMENAQKAAADSTPPLSDKGSDSDEAMPEPSASIMSTPASGSSLFKIPKRGAGVDDAIHRACQPEMDCLQSALQTLHTSNGSDFTAGSVLLTDAFGNLRQNVQFIAHACRSKRSRQAPICRRHFSFEIVLYTAFPNIAIGTNGFPRDLAAAAALEAILSWLNTNGNEERVQQINLVSFRLRDKLLYRDLIEMAKRQIVSSRQSTPRTSLTNTPTTSRAPTPLPCTVIDKPSPIVAQAIQAPVRCVNVEGDGDCFYRAICYGLFRVDSMQNSDALRLASGRILRTILNDPNFFPRERHATHAEFTHQLQLALLPSPSNLWYNQTLEAYSRFIEIPARTGNGRWAQLDDAHTIAILLRRPVVILRPAVEDAILLQQNPRWNNTSIRQRIDVRFPDGEYMGMIRNIPHAQLNNFTVRRTQQNIVEERTVDNPIVIWFDGIGHYQSIIFDPIAPNASDGSEYIFAQHINTPDAFLHMNHQQQQLQPAKVGWIYGLTVACKVVEELAVHHKHRGQVLISQLLDAFRDVQPGSASALSKCRWGKDAASDAGTFKKKMEAIGQI